MLGRDLHLIVAGLVKMGTGSECHGTTFRSPENTSQIFQFVMGVPEAILTAKFSTVPTQKLTSKLSIHTKRRLGLVRVVGFLIALRVSGVCWLCTLRSQSV